MKRKTGDTVAIPGDYQYHAYYYGKTPQRFWHYNRLAEALKSLDLHDGDTVLDIGCGSGLMASFIAKNPTIQVLAVDANYHAIHFAEKMFQMPNLEFRYGMIDELRLPKESFHRINYLEVIEHIFERQGDYVFESFYKLLKPGGKLVISTPNKKSLWPLIEWVLDTFKITPVLSHEQHEFLYTDHLLCQKAAQVGFSCIDKKHLNTIAPWLALFNWQVALKVNEWEIAHIKKCGSILLYTFQKPLNIPSETI